MKVAFAVVLAVLAAWAGGSPVHAAARERNPRIGDVTPQRLVEQKAAEWLTPGRDWRQSYHSPLSAISKANVRRLGFAWSHDIAFNASFQATPIVVDGVMFTSANRGAVHALEARSGAVRWSFEPELDPAIFRSQCCGGVNRGVAVWRGKVYVAAVDGQLYALDAGTGAIVWRVRTIEDLSRSYTSTGAPYIAGNRVVIGNSGAEYDARGYITAYDAETGRLAWRFFTVPGDPKKGFEHPELEKAASTWDPHSLWEVGLGGTAWDGMAYDPALNLLYVGTGNGTPWNRKLRSPAGGDNLFLSSILAINPDTGRLVWHYQTTPGDNWDYTATQKLILADLEIGGALRKVLMQAPKNGFFYVIDRATGELISARPHVYVNWASHVDPKTGRPVETGKGDYSQAPKLVFPTTQGAHNWNPMSYSPRTGLVYIPAQEAGEVFGLPSVPFEYRKDQWNIGMVQRRPIPGPLGLSSPATREWPSLEVLRGAEPDPAPRRWLRAWDPVRQRLVWQVEMPGGVDNSGFSARKLAGVLSTAGDLVFQGDVDGHLRVFDARTGQTLHDIDVGTSITAAPMSYAIGGEQYIALMAGANAGDPSFVDYKYGNMGRVVAFKLGGGSVPKRPVLARSHDVDAPPALPDAGTGAQIEEGGRLFESHCAACHAYEARAPDLTRMSVETHREFFRIVREGTRVLRGMPTFGDALSERQAEAVHAYIVHVAWQNHRNKQPR